MTTRAATYGDLDGTLRRAGHDGEADPRFEEDELIMHLERDQFVAETSRPVPRAPLGPHATFALWALRVFAVVVSLMVVYTFIHQLH
jgi:hypothetical protein